MTRVRFGWLLFVGMSSLAACSGASDGDLFGAGGGAGGDGTGSGEDAASPTDNDAAGETDGGVARADGSVRRDGGGGTNDGGTVEKDADPGDVAHPDVFVSTREIRCSADGGANACGVGQDVCCKSSTSYACTTASSCQTPSIAIPCDDALDCADMGMTGSLCCAQLTNSGKVTEVTCRAQADCQTADNRRTLCDPNDTDPCPNGGTCKLSSITLPGFYVCF